MTFIFGSWTLGAALLFSAIKNMTLIQLIRGESGPGQPASIVDSAFGAASGSSGSTVAAGTVQRSGLTTFDGKQVCNWIAEILVEARKSGMWKGRLNSGYRSPEHSVAVGGNAHDFHTGTAFPSCAVDVTDAAGLDRFTKLYARQLVYAPQDPCNCHFSHPHGGAY